MRAFLAFRVWTRTMSLLHITRFAQTAVRADRKNCCVATHIVRSQNKSALCVHLHVTRAAAQRRLLIQKPQGAARWIDRKGTYSSAFCACEFIDFIHCVKITPVPREREKRR